MFDPYDPTDEFASDGGGNSRIVAIELDANDLIQFSMRIYNDSQWNYSENKKESARNLDVSKKTLINSQYSYSEAVSLIDGFISEFPTEADISLIEQAAYWERWFAGMHFFRNANHRTAYFSLQEIMQKNDISELPRLKNVNEEKSETAIDASRRVRQELEIDEESMFRKDDLYNVWESFFEDILS
jgi:hypothetical protein